MENIVEYIEGVLENSPYSQDEWKEKLEFIRDSIETEHEQLGKELEDLKRDYSLAVKMATKPIDR